MARRTIVEPIKPATAVVPANPDGEPNPLGDRDLVPGEQAEHDIKRAVAELGESATGAKVQVWRIIKGERLPAYVTTYQPEAFSLEKVADDCGGGTYDIKVFAPRIDEQGRQAGLIVVARPRVFLDGPPKVIQRPDKEPEKKPESTSPSDIAVLAKAMMDGFEKMGASIARMNDRPSMVETLKELVAIKSLFSSDAPRGPDPLDQFEKFLNMRDKMESAVDRLPADANDNALLIALGRDFLKMFNKATDAGAPAALPNPGSQADPAHEAAPAPGPEIPPGAAAPAPVEDDPMNVIFKGYVQLLVNNAKANNDIEPIAQTIYDQAPDDMLAKLLNTPEWLDELAKLNPAVKLYPQYFERLRARIKEIHDASGTE